MINLTWTEQAWNQANHFSEFESSWETFMHETAKDMAEYAKEYIKPMLNVRTSPRGNGDTARSIDYSISTTGDGLEINYTGLLSAWWMDVGNFPAGEIMRADGIKAFPVDKRFGTPMYKKEIHGMGHFTPGVPTHWSEETVKHMDDDGVALEFAVKHLERFLSEVVITV
jgi:hypothetical protein